MQRLFDRSTWTEVFETLKKNKKRTLTTMAGVFWGLLLLTLLLSFGEGLINGQRRAFNALGDDGQVVIVSPSLTTIPYKGYAKDRPIYLTDQDCKALKASFPAINTIETIVTNWSRRGSIYANGIKNTYFMLYGVSPNYFNVMKVKLLEGRRLTIKDEMQQTHNCLLGVDLAKKLFPEGGAVGSAVQLQDASYTVVGIIQPESDNFAVFSNIRNDVIIPQSLMLSLYIPTRNYAGLVIHYRDIGVSSQELTDSIQSFLKERHSVAPEDKAAISIFDASQVLNLSNALMRGISILVWIVGIGTLLAGIVGITNILLVSISERTKEIGIRKALGARNKDIRFQILLESFTITFIAGMLGSALGIGIMLLVDKALGSENSIFLQPIIPTAVMFIIIFIIAISGLLAGLLPVSRALKIDTIKALQEE